MPSPPPIEPKLLRSGVATMLFWMGAAIGALAILGVLALMVGGLVSGDGSMVLGGLILGAVFGGGGAVMHLLGRRQWVRLHSDGIEWRTALSQPTRVPWRDVHHVEMPQAPSQGRQVRLVLFNGRRIPVSAITMSSSEYGASADSGYWNCGVEIINAHKAWLALR